MKHLFIFIFLILSLMPSSAQNNPFDINRSEEKTETTNQETSSRKNVFDITVSNQEHDTQKTSITDTFAIVSSETNPFDVSHVPLRVSKLKQEATALQKPVSSSTSSASNTFIFWMTLLSAVLLAIVINTNRTLIPTVIRSIPNENILKSSQRQESGGRSSTYIMLYVSFFINFSILIYLLIKHWAPSMATGIYAYLAILTVISLVYTIKHVLLNVSGWIYAFGEYSGLYSFAVSLFNNFLGLVIIPLNLLIAFGPESIANIIIYITIGVVILMLGLRYLRGFTIGLRLVSLHMFQFLLYLCAFEIIPFCLLAKYIIGY